MTDIDIVSRLVAAAENAPADLAELLKQAAEDIETLRMMVGIREEVELEFAEPAGSA
ncbi:hypothetical protein [Bosea sp. Root381]|uniref:hypothetical protein n=1 Tax=Bosea sp. Root381 TaxID=1736524 RepID=UPI000A988787|nr:hypothetical protein [Bosea sp. Root381]